MDLKMKYLLLTYENCYFVKANNVVAKQAHRSVNHEVVQKLIYTLENCVFFEDAFISWKSTVHIALKTTDSTLKLSFTMAIVRAALFVALSFPCRTMWIQLRLTFPNTNQKINIFFLHHQVLLNFGAIIKQFTPDRLCSNMQIDIIILKTVSSIAFSNMLRHLLDHLCAILNTR